MDSFISSFLCWLWRLLVSLFETVTYNSYMSLRTVVKKIIPTGVFQRVEPFGHLLEAVLANVRYGFPGKKLKAIGVTGTNGKTTTSFMIYRILHEAGYNVGISTTVGHGTGSNIVTQTEHITTAQSGVLQKRLRDFYKKGVEWAVVETSSHALAQNRVWGVNYEIAVMTNVTHDHIDYHKTFDRYLEAKRRLFSIANKSKTHFGVVNADDPSADIFTKSIKEHKTYSLKNGDLVARDIELFSDGSEFMLHIGDQSIKIRVNIPGEFNISNTLAAAAVANKLGLSLEQIKKGIESLKTVDGRMTVIDEGQAFKVIVDFASTPDSFEKFFQSVKPLVKGKLIAVFCSAGRRDPTKRYVQGKIAGDYADIVVATEEDDRDEDGLAILTEIARGVKESGKKENDGLFLEPSRESAIKLAFSLAEGQDDTVVILGKGHERTIERSDGEHPWSDIDVSRKALKELQNN